MLRKFYRQILKREIAPSRKTVRKGARSCQQIWLQVEELEPRLVPNSYVVNTSADNVAGSLRAAVDAANAAGGSNTITFAAAVSGQTITLASNDTYNATTFGPTGLVIGKSAALTDNLTIQGDPNLGVTISGNNARRIFAVNSGSTLTLDDVTITGGLAQGGAGGSGSGGGGGGAGLGGAIFNASGASLIIQSSTFSGNIAQGGAGGAGLTAFTGGGGGGLGGNGGNGGAAGANGGSGGGPNGGVGNAGRPANPGSGGGPGFGGGGAGGGSNGGGYGGAGGGFGGGGGGESGTYGWNAYGPGGFGGGGGGDPIANPRPGYGNSGSGGFGGGSGNSTSGGGGGGAGLGGAIFNNGGTVTITNSTFTGNSALGGAGAGGAGNGQGLGGAVFNRNGNVTFTSDTLAANTVGGPGVSNGGAVFNLANGANATLTFFNSIFAGSAGGSDVANQQTSGTATINAAAPHVNIVQSGIANISGIVNQTGVLSGAASNPNLGSLASNGGPTQTMLPGAGPAIDSGRNADAAGLITDQRGFAPRIVNLTIDLGAVEVGAAPAAPPSITSANNTTFTAGMFGTFTVTTSGNPSKVVLTETGALPNGVSFVDNGNGTATLSGMAALGSTTTFTITASNGIAPDATQSFTLTVLASPTATTTTAASQTAIFSSSNQNVTLTATVTSTSVVNEGTVTFKVFDSSMIQVGATTPSGTVSNGVASVSFVLPGGTAIGVYTIDAIYNPGPDYLGSDNSTQSPVPTLTVNPRAATTTTAGSPTTVFGSSNQTVTLTASVTSTSIVNQGTVTFKVFDSSMNQVGATTTSGTVSNGVASASFTLPGGKPVGVYTIAAIYNPGPKFLNSDNSTQSPAATLTVSQAPTTTTVTTPPPVFVNPSGQSVLLAATVSSTNGPASEGSVTFQVGGGIVVPATSFVGGVATLLYALPGGTSAGAYTITAVYTAGPDYDPAGSSDNTHTLTVNNDATSTSVTTVSPSSLVFSTSTQTVNLIATVTDTTNGGTTVNLGTVTFKVFKGGVQQGTTVVGSVSGGTASVNFTLPAGSTPGTYTITASYNDTSFFFADSSNSSQSFTVTQATTTTTLTSANQSAFFGSANQNITLTASVTTSASAGTVNQGTVTFQLKNNLTNTLTTAGTVSVSSGVATLTTNDLPGGTPVGSYTIIATYNGGTNFTGSDTSSQPNPPMLTVSPASTSLTVNNATAIFGSANQNVTLSAVVTATNGSGSVNQGTVSFQVFQGLMQIGSTVTSGTVSGGNASAVFVLPGGTAALGTYTILATYDPAPQNNYLTSNNNTQSPAATLTVNQASTSVAALNATADFGSIDQNVTLSALVTATNGKGPVTEGSVTFTILKNGMVVGTTATAIVNAINGGNVSTTYVLPGGTAAGTYTILATYTPGADYLGSSSNKKQTLTVNPAQTMTVAVNQSAFFGSANQNVTLSAVVTATTGAGSVNEGTVTFQVFQGLTQIGAPTTSGTVSGGNASAVFILPGGTAALGTYTIVATYNPGADYLTSNNNTQSPAATLQINQASTSLTVNNSAAFFGSVDQNVTLSAVVSATNGSGSVNEGTVSFQVFQGATQLGVTTTSGTVNGGNASATFVLPGGTAALGTYTIVALYNPGADYLTSNNSTQSPKPTLTVNQASTSVAAVNVTPDFGSVNQNVTLSAQVTATNGAGPVVEGSVTFTIFNGAKVVGTTVTAIVNAINGGNVSATYVLPGGTVAGTYTILATYNPGADYLTSNNNKQQTLTVIPAQTKTTAVSQTAFFGTVNQNVTLSAVVKATTGAGPVNEGTVTFQVFQGATQIGVSVTSSKVNGGNASATFVMPASTPLGTYTIIATYNPSADYVGSNDKTHTLTVNPAFTVGVAADQTAIYDDIDQNVMLSAVVTATTGAGPVNEGTVTFQVFQGLTQIGAAVTSSTVSGGNASAIFVLPAFTSIGTYTILASYSPAGDYISNTDNSHTLSVTAGPASQFVFITQPPASSTAGVSFDVVVEAEDRFGFQATSFNSNVAMQIGTDPSQGQAILNGVTVRTASAGLVSFTLSINSAFNGYTLVASTASIQKTSSSIDITPAAPALVLFTAEPPPSTAAGHQFTVVAEVFDAFGNLTTNFSGAVTVGFGADPSHGDATLAGALPINLSSGLASFTLAIDKASTGYVLLTTVAGLSAFTNSFDVTGSITDASTVTSTLTSSAASAGTLAPSLGAAAASAARSALVSAVAAVPGVRLNRLFIQTLSVAGGESNSAAVEAKKVTLPTAVVLPPPIVPVKPPIGPVSPPSLPTGTGEKPPVVTPATVGTEPAAILQNDALWNKLDTLKDQVTASPPLTGKIVGTVSIAVVASLGYLLLAGRVFLWLLLAMSAKPLWSEFDPMEVLTDWEKKKGLAQGTDEDESLQSMVERK